MKILLSTLLGGVLLFSGCSESRTLSFSIENLSISAEGPLFEGSNTAQGNYEVALEAFLSQNGSDLDQVKAIRLKNANLSTAADTLNFDLVKAITLQFASDQTEMIEGGVLNPVPAAQQKVALKMPTEPKNLIDFFRQKQFTIVSDLDLKQDQESNLELLGNFEFEVVVK
jgi:hypothetical protein